MANFFNLTLDTLAPSISAFLINNGASITSNRAVTLTIASSDADVTSMKIWGYDQHTTEASASWETFAGTKSVNLPATDGQYTLHIKVRDDVYNESAESTATITLSTAIPAITITGPDVEKISEISGKNLATFSFTSDTALSEYTVRVVPTQNSAHDAGTEIPTTNGSVNMHGTTVAANTAVTCKINGSDFKTAIGGSDGTYIVKVFGRSAVNGLWSA
ncbi:MAG: hypothetical protein K6A77_11415 [Clostridiales bacterium]|nr:hypothetical protein [Clostridiales bacterium]